MKTLAEISLEFIWHLLFDGEEIVELDYSVAWQESLPDYFSAMNADEKVALSEAAQSKWNRLLAPPDEHGYTPRKLVTDEQKRFLESVISGDLFKEFE